MCFAPLFGSAIIFGGLVMDEDNQHLLELDAEQEEEQAQRHRLPPPATG